MYFFTESRNLQVTSLSLFLFGRALQSRNTREGNNVNYVNTWLFPPFFSPFDTREEAISLASSSSSSSSLSSLSSSQHPSGAASSRLASSSFSRGVAIYIWPAWAAHVGLTAKPTETGYTHKRAARVASRRVGKRHTPGRRTRAPSSLHRRSFLAADTWQPAPPRRCFQQVPALQPTADSGDKSIF